MKTFRVYTSDGKTVGVVKGDDVSVGSSVIIVKAGGKIVAVVPFEGGFSVIADD